jgi:hypothetical protein
MSKTYLKSDHFNGGWIIFTAVRFKAQAVFSEAQIDHFVMAITSAEASVWHSRASRVDLNTAYRGWAREIRMRKIGLCVAASVVIATGVTMWAASTTKARVPASSQGIDTLQMMLNAKGLATSESYDHGFVFH